MGLRDTSLHTAGFIYGITGTATAVGFITWALTIDWPFNIGGKPHFSLPAWIPITFELTVLFASIGMVLTFCYLCQMAPFVKKDHFNLRSTDDLFVMALECTDKTNDAELSNFLQSLGAKDVQVVATETLAGGSVSISELGFTPDVNVAPSSVTGAAGVINQAKSAKIFVDGLQVVRDSNVIEVYVKHLRDKLGAACITTRRGQGYVFEVAP